MKNKNSVFYMVLASLFAALIAVFTAFIFRIPIKIGANSAYIHFGDAFIFLAASILPTPYAVAAAGIGGALGDLFLRWCRVDFLYRNYKNIGSTYFYIKSPKNALQTQRIRPFYSTFNNGWRILHSRSTYIWQLGVTSAFGMGKYCTNYRQCGTLYFALRYSWQ